ncbi:hypothetical protein [Brevundimonas sp.]|jgi:hypothetical protein|uniref:hypothetical protein n=1 Tax=Brevundimonas sp. TaxID=1871086 RepID=UPI0037C0D56D
MTRLTVSRASDAEAVVQEAQALEWETQRETEQWRETAGDRPSDERFEEVQERYWALREAAAAVVDILYELQGPSLGGPYSAWATDQLETARNLLADIKKGELVEKTSLVPISSTKK